VNFANMSPEYRTTWSNIKRSPGMVSLARDYFKFMDKTTKASQLVPKPGRTARIRCTGRFSHINTMGSADGKRLRATGG
jgi:hypothetical protein